MVDGQHIAYTRIVRMRYRVQLVWNRENKAGEEHSKASRAGSQSEIVQKS